MQPPLPAASLSPATKTGTCAPDVKAPTALNSRHRYIYISVCQVVISLWEIKSHLMKGQYRDANEKYFTLMIGTAPHTFLTRLAKTEGGGHLRTHSFVLLYHTNRQRTLAHDRTDAAGRNDGAPADCQAVPLPRIAAEKVF